MELAKLRTCNCSSVVGEQLGRPLRWRHNHGQLLLTYTRSSRRCRMIVGKHTGTTWQRFARCNDAGGLQCCGHGTAQDCPVVRTDEDAWQKPGASAAPGARRQRRQALPLRSLRRQLLRR